MVIKRVKKNKTYFTNDFYSGIWQVVVDSKKVIFAVFWPLRYGLGP